MKNIYKFYLVLFSITIFSCEDVVDIPLETGVPKLVIDANINWLKGTNGANQQIKLSQTTGFYENTQPPATGATVIVKNSSNVNFIFTEDAQSGVYKCTNFTPLIDENYTLTITYKGEIYTATDKLYATPEIIGTTQETVTGFGGESEFEVKFLFQDNANETNYYLNEEKIDFKLLTDFFASRDEFFNGNIMFGLVRNSDMKVGSKIDFTLHGISLEYYTYMRALINQSGVGGGNPFAPPPATLRGNIVNATKQSNFPLGYFKLSETAKKSYTIL